MTTRECFICKEKGIEKCMVYRNSEEFINKGYRGVRFGKSKEIFICETHNTKEVVDFLSTLITGSLAILLSNERKTDSKDQSPNHSFADNCSC